LAGADYQIRETFESALLFGQQALREVEVPEEEIMAIVEDIRGRDRERMLAELSTGGLESSRKFIHGNLPKPSPLVEPKRESKILNPEGISDIPLVDSTTST
jgi:glutathione-regulated potassium-efflux system protein KefB